MDTRWLIFVPFLGLCAIASGNDYDIDLQTPRHITDLPRTVTLPTRVDVYRTGPHVYIDKRITPWALQGERPLLSLTNRAEIDNFVSLLQQNDNKERITNANKRVGNTYHFLLFQDRDKTVMHFRAFEASENKSPWLMIYPRASPQFAYFNDQLASWLKTHLESSPDVVDREGMKKLKEKEAPTKWESDYENKTVP
jgi:hypothetical protein